MTIDTKQLRADALGLAGRFFYDAERGDIAYIAKDCDDRTCDCEKKLNSDGDQDCAFSIADGLDDHVAESLVRVLNAAGPLLDELEAAKAESKALRESLIHACDLLHASQDNERQLRAMRQTANMLSLPFSHDRVQEKYNEWESNEALRSQLAAVTKARDEACDWLADMVGDRDDREEFDG